ncbi:glycogen debranching enzyme [Coniochaeta sp. 2T2.1]|nr:glycogen debranching enzyme [Coniochaeta sp. 2T2.1]
MVKFVLVQLLVALATPGLSARFTGRADGQLFACGDAFYSKSKYTCYDGDFLCPVLDGQPTLRCNEDCYLPSMYGCDDNHLVQVPAQASTASAAATTSSTATGSVSSPSASATCVATRFHLSDPPYEDYFLSDCNSAAQVVVTSPLPDSNLTRIGPRLLVAWPAGNSGVVAYFAPRNGGENGTLSIALTNSSKTGNQLDPVFEDTGSGNPIVGVTGSIELNASATLNIAILGSIRTIRDFTEGPSILQPSIQKTIKFTDKGNGTVELSRLWLDNITTTTFSFTSTSDNSPTINNQTVNFEAGTYTFSASFNYPQLEQLDTQEILSPSASSLQTTNETQVASLSFLSYTDKLLAGGWRFLTYFGRDTMISLLLTEPILSTGNGSATEAVIGAVLERLNRTDGSAAHEETIGDYSTWLNLQKNITSTAPQYDYKMVDTDYYLPVALADYLIANPDGKSRAEEFLAKEATVNPANADLTYGELALINAEKIMNTSAPFAAQGNQTKDNLIHLKEGQVVGQWRDSEFGIGGGRIPYDVNTALVPAALNAISLLATAGFFPSHPEWNDTASRYAKLWEDNTLSFFNISIPASEARDLVSSYVSDNALPFPDRADNISSPVNFYAIALDGNNNQSQVRVMNTDDCFRLFLLNSTNSSQLGPFLSQTADHILSPFPVGLLTDVGLVVANPAYGGDPVYGKNFTRSDYHGTVVWSWQLSMMAKGLERQIARCNDGEEGLEWCGNGELRDKVVRAYNVLWDTIERNGAELSSEVWSWTWEGDGFRVTPFGELSTTESDVVQLWSLTFLAVRRDEGLK